MRSGTEDFWHKEMTLKGLGKVLIDPVFILLTLMVAAFILSRKQGKTKSIKISRIALASAIFALYTFSIHPLPNLLAYILEKDYLQIDNNIKKVDIVVVLGGGILERGYLKEPRLSHEAASRVIYGIQTFKRAGADYIVFLGKGEKEISEAEVMANAARMLGVPESRIKVETRSMNTREHVLALRDIFKNRDLHIALVTSAYHMKRSQREFGRYYPHLVPMPSDYLYSPLILSIKTFVPKASNLYKFSVVVREMVGIVWYKII